MLVKTSDNVLPIDGPARIVDVRRMSSGADLEIAVDGAPVAIAPSPLAAIPHVQRPERRLRMGEQRVEPDGFERSFFQPG